MKTLLTALVALFAILTMSCGGSSSPVLPEDSDLYGGLRNIVSVADDSGNVYTVGSFHGAVDFDPGPGVVKRDTGSSYKHDAFVAKFDPNGALTWVQTWKSTRHVLGEVITVDDYGNVYAGGRFSGTVDFNPSEGIEEHEADGNADVFLVKLDSDGKFQWTWFWSDENDLENITGLSAFSDSLFVTGYLSGSGFLMKMDTEGKGRIEQKIFFTNKMPISVSANSDAVYVTGDFTGGGTNGLGDVFLSRIDHNGHFQWSRTWGGHFSDSGKSVSVDSLGNLYVIGTFELDVDFDPGDSVDEHESTGVCDVFLSKFDPDGNFLWTRTWGGRSWDEALNVIVDRNDRLYTIGYIYDFVDFDPGENLRMQGLPKLDSVFLSQFDTEGDFIDVEIWGSSTKATTVSPEGMVSRIEWTTDGLSIIN